MVRDEALIGRAAGGDEVAFALIYERHRRSVFGFAYRMVGAVEPAEDVTQECFLALLRQARRFDAGRASLRTFLFAMARNLVLKHFRDTGQEVPLEDTDRQDEATGPLGQVLGEETGALVRAAIAALPVLQREALILAEYEDLSLAEIAAVAGADVGTVKSRLHRAREALRRSLASLLKGEYSNA